MNRWGQHPISINLPDVHAMLENMRESLEVIRERTAYAARIKAELQRSQQRFSAFSDFHSFKNSVSGADRPRDG